MTRRAHRDPRSRLELRRLAYRVPREENARLVLVDALYETYPRVFHDAIERAEEGWRQRYGEQAVLLIPERMHPTKRTYFQRSDLGDGPFTDDPFSIQTISADVLTSRYKHVSTRSFEEEVRKRPGFRNAVLVYRTRGAL